ncbi:winged helix-turn-helix domain-containing protein [Shewanella khirikhana]|uniref:Transcriptional activator CadC n=1 Tax=Shewanella khirikhana TaxID=1965282 RepID=A0ABN5TQD0_9GAMM|nr:winged helix-turn-helix domain-containing protein [Shewanella khirikhana]AZQ09291.1 Transcriptional activator CadC [Shewanella khirikhana]
MFNNNKYRLGEYLVVPERCVVSREGIDTKLELRVMQVLVCLLERAGRPVSRDELIKEVWRGGVVSDNAINRIIALLRSALGDDARSQKVIKTVPKVGYLVVAEIEQINTPLLKPAVSVPESHTAATLPGKAETENKPAFEAVTYDQAPNHINQQLATPVKTPRHGSSRSGRLLGYALAGLTVSLAIMGGIQYFSKAPPIENISPIKDVIASLEPLTSLDGQEVDPILSPDGSLLAFSFRPLNEERWRVLVQDLRTGVVSHVAGSFLGKMNGRYPAWAEDGRHLAYLRYDGVARCELVLVDIASQDEQIVGSCGATNQSSALTFNGRQLFYIDSASIEDFKKIYRLDLDTLQKEQISQPHITGRGDLSFALSPDGSQLAVLRNSGWSDTQIMLFTFSSGEWRSLHKVGYPLRSIAWSGDGKSLIYRAEEGQLHQYDLASGQVTRITKILQEINSPKSNARGQVTAVVGELVEEEIWLWDSPMTTDSSPKPWISSSRRDYRGAISPDGSRAVFVSTKTGLPQIWMREFDGVEHKLTDLKRFSYIDELSFSMDGSMVAGSINGAAFTLDLATAHLNMVPNMTMVRNISFGIKHGELVMTDLSDSSGKIKLVNAFSGEELRVLVIGGYSGKYDWATGDFYFSKKHVRGTWSLKNGVEKLITEDFTPVFSESWLVDNKDMWYLEKDDGQFYLTRQSVNTNEKVRVDINVKHLSLRNMSMSKDRKILLSVLTNSNTDVVYLN